MASDLDKLILDSNVPAFIDKESGSFQISLSGSISSGATKTWSGSVSFTNPTGYVRYMLTQDVVPAIAKYTNNEAVPLAILVGGSSFAPWLASSGPATEVSPNIYLSSTQSGATVTVSYTNGSGSTLTVTPTVMTIHFTPYVNSIT